MESTDSSTCSQYPNLPPGFRFHPTDEELVVHYLKKKASAVPLPISIIAEVDLYKFDPWELPSKAIFGDQEWYFFSPRDRKYPNGMRPNRAATSGYWKATGTDKPILSSTGDQKVGVKKALVFYGGKPPKGVKTSWIMHEYRLVDNASMKSPVPGLSSKKGSLRLDEWVLCRVYKKNNASSRSATERDTDQDNYFEIINNSQDGSRLRQTCNSISKLDSSSSSLNSGVSSMVLNPGKRPFPATTHYWNLESTDQKRFHSEDQDMNGMMDGNGSFISLLNPGHQGININGGGGFHQNTVLGSLCDSTFPYQLSSLNWHP